MNFQQLGLVDNDDLDSKDSNVPRFTITELKEVLKERNELKNRLNDLEEEMTRCKPISSTNDVATKVIKNNEEDAPVQGKFFFDDIDIDHRILFLIRTIARRVVCFGRILEKEKFWIWNTKIVIFRPQQLIIMS